MSYVDSYFEKVVELLKIVREEEKGNIVKAAEVFADTIERRKPIHFFATGHTQNTVIDVFNRGGEFYAYNGILDPALSVVNGALRTTFVERLHGYAKVVADYYDLKEGEAITIISNSGINAVPIEMAMIAKDRGMKVIVLTSVSWSKSMPSRHSSGKKLFELGDIVIDNHVPMGDAVIEVPGMFPKVSPISTIVNCTILHSISAETCKILIDRGIDPPVRIIHNVKGGFEYNLKLKEKWPEYVHFKHR
ncbi:MAG: sugar isomerase domain-containing protein [Candidatus Asgardarchaeia archaeon]